MIIILMGAPGSGKGTVAEKMHKKHRFPILSAGEMLRDEMDKETEVGKQVSRFVLSGELVPDEIMNTLIETKIKKKQNKTAFILDGYPRNLNQALALDEVIKKHQVVFYLDIPKHILMNRLLNRGRTDDTEKIIERRFEIYIEETQPLIDYYTRKKVLVKISGESSIDIFKKIENVLSVLI